MRVYKLRPGCCADDWTPSEFPTDAPPDLVELGVNAPADVLDIRPHVSAKGFERVFYAGGVFYGAREVIL